LFARFAAADHIRDFLMADHRVQAHLAKIVGAALPLARSQSTIQSAVDIQLSRYNGGLK